MLEIISTKDAPKAIGPYSQAIAFKDLLFVSGQIGINPKTASIDANTIEGQTRQVMNNVQAILSAAGSNLTKVLKCTVFLSDMQDFATFNNIYGEYFPQTPPARTTVQAAGLPRNVKVEVDVIACRDE